VVGVKRGSFGLGVGGVGGGIDVGKEKGRLVRAFAARKAL